MKPIVSVPATNGSTSTDPVSPPQPKVAATAFTAIWPP